MASKPNASGGRTVRLRCALGLGLSVFLGVASPAGLAAQMPTPAASPPDLVLLVDSVVEATMAERHIPGAVVVLVRDGQVVLRRGYGVSDVENASPVDPSATVFRLGSVSKALTALALLQLVDEGAIALDDPVERYVEPQVLPPDPGRPPVLVRHLLTHTGGFDQTGHGRLSASRGPRPTLERFLEEQLVRVRDPGVVPVYDTYGMSLAGHLVERVSGQGYHAYMRDHVFAPLGMSMTSVETFAVRWPRLAVGYGFEDDVLAPQEYEWYVTLPASSIDATAEDMGRLMMALLGDGGTATGRLFSAAMARRIREEPLRLADRATSAFSWGFFDEERDGYRILRHGGVMAGYSSELYLVPEAGLGMFVAYNRDPETGTQPLLRERLVETLHERLLPRREEEERDPGAVGPGAAASDRFAGLYVSTLGCFTCAGPGGWPLNTVVLASPEPGVLTRWGRRYVAVGPTTFRDPENGATLRFLTDASGRARYFVQGASSFARLDELLLAEVAGRDWGERPATPLLAVMMRDSERWAQAAAVYEELASRFPEHGEYAYYEGLGSLHVGRTDAALAAFRRALELGKWRGWSQYYIASAHAARGEGAEALAAFARALELGFGDPNLPRNEPWWDQLRGRPEFIALMRQLEGED